MCSIDLDYPEFWSTSEPVAKKQHKCSECQAPIPRGEKHMYKAGKWGGEFRAYRSHMVCEALRDFIEGAICGGGDIALGYLVEECGDAYVEYIRHYQNDEAWEAAGQEAPNPLAQVLEEIRAYYDQAVAA